MLTQRPMARGNSQKRTQPRDTGNTAKGLENTMPVLSWELGNILKPTVQYGINH